MADPNELPLRLTLDEREFVQRMKKATTFVRRNVTAIRDSVELIGMAWNSASRAVSMFASVVAQAVQEADRQERLERRVVTGLKLRGEFTEKAWKELQTFNAQLDRRLGLGDEELLQLQGTLAAMGVNTAQMQSATRATIGLTQATGGSLADASRVVAKVMQGQVSALREYGIIVDTTAEAQQELNKLFGIAETQGGDTTTQLARMSNATGDAFQAFGELLDKGLGVNEALRDMASLMRGVADAAQSTADAIGKGEGNAFTPGNTSSGLVGSFSDLGGRAAFASMELTEVRRRIREAAEEAEKQANKLSPLQEFLAEHQGKGFLAPDRPTTPGIQSLLRGQNNRPDVAQPRPSVRPGGGRAGGGLTANVGFRLLNQRSLPGFSAVEQGSASFQDEGITLPGVAAAARLRELKDQMLGDIGPQLVSGVGNLFADLGAAMAAGSLKAEQVLARFAGNMISTLGDMLIQFGTAALGLAPLSVIPGMQGIAGPPGAAAAAGVGAIAIGAALKLAGGALGASAGGAPARGAVASRSAQPTSQVASGFSGFGRGTTVVNVSFGVVGDRRAAGRLVQGLLNDARGLSLGS